MKCATVHGENEIDNWITHKNRAVEPQRLVLGEVWWWGAAVGVQLNSTIVSAHGQIRNASIKSTRHGSELVPEYRHCNKSMLVHIKVTPFYAGGVRYTTRLKKGRKLAERRLINGAHQVQELLVEMGDGDYVIANRTGELNGEPADLIVRACSKSNLVSCVRR